MPDYKIAEIQVRQGVIEPSTSRVHATLITEATEKDAFFASFLTHGWIFKYNALDWYDLPNLYVTHKISSNAVYLFAAIEFSKVSNALRIMERKFANYLSLGGSIKQQGTTPSPVPVKAPPSNIISRTPLEFKHALTKNSAKQNVDIDPVTKALMASALKTHGKGCCPKCNNKGMFIKMALTCPQHGVFGGA
jgi:hypothetical protein